MKKFIKRMAVIIGGLIVALVAAITLLMMIGVSLDLSWMRGGVEASAGAALDRDVQINGPVTLHFSGTPGIEANEVSIGNVSGAKADQLLTAGLVRLSIGLSPLLRGNIQLGEVTAQDVILNLESDANGRGNWIFGAHDNGDREPAPSPKETDATSAVKTEERRWRLTGLDQLSLQRVAVNYHDAALNKSVQFALDSLGGRRHRENWSGSILEVRCRISPSISA